MDLPVDAESIRAGAEVVAPEHVLEFHRDLSAFRERGKDAVNVLAGGSGIADGVVGADNEGWAEAGRRIAAHKDAVADGQADVHNLVVPPVRHGRHVIGGRHVRERHHVQELAPKDTSIRLKRLEAVLLKVDIHGKRGEGLLLVILVSHVGGVPFWSSLIFNLVSFARVTQEEMRCRTD